MEIVASVLLDLWSEWLWPILLLVVGLGLVIVVHELGHFLMAKWVGIRVERFAMGFGPRLVGFKRGETDYCINLLPLGGYVKLAGQEDFKPLAENEKPDPRSFMAKPVGARLLVISGGVVMNVILAGVLFVIIGLVGKNFAAPVIQGTVPGMPAAEGRIKWDTPQAGAGSNAGAAPDDRLTGGDRIVRLDGHSVVLWVINHEITNFTDVAMTAILASPHDKFEFTIERDYNGRKWTGTTEIGVKDDDGKLLFGLQTPFDTVVGNAKGIIADTPFRPKDRIVEVAGRKVSSHWDIDKAEESLGAAPVTVAVERAGRREEIKVVPILSVADGVYRLKNGTVLRGRIVNWQDKKVERPRADGEAAKVAVREYEVRLADGSTRKFLDVDQDFTQLPRILGMMPRMRIHFVIEGKPADKAGLRPGDIILNYGEVRLPSHEQLLNVNEKFVGKETSITLLRGKAENRFSISPRRRDRGAVIGVQLLADQGNPIVGFVDKGSAADKAGIVSGSEITAINGIEVRSWGDIYTVLSGLMGKKVSIAYCLGSATKLAEIPKLDESMFNPKDCCFRLFAGDVAFEPLTVRIAQPGAWSALEWGCREAFKLVLSTYVSIRSLISGYASTETVSGPVGIGAIAISVGRKSFVDFVYLMGFISAALAVFNFLPLPVVDGGHAVFLIIEKIRGKPVPVKIMNVVQMIGLALILFVFVALTWQDIARIVSGL